MTRFLPVILFITLLVSGCRKAIEDKIIGKWKLDKAYRQKPFNKDEFTTGFEAGIFTFNEDGSANYTSTSENMDGYWETDFYSAGYWDSNGDWVNRRFKAFKVELVNFQQNIFLSWDFDDFKFRNGRSCIKATQFTAGADRVYEFIKQ